MRLAFFASVFWFAILGFIATCTNTAPSGSDSTDHPIHGTWYGAVRYYGENDKRVPRLIFSPEGEYTDIQTHYRLNETTGVWYEVKELSFQSSNLFLLDEDFLNFRGPHPKDTLKHANTWYKYIVTADSLRLNIGTVDTGSNPTLIGRWETPEDTNNVTWGAGVAIYTPDSLLITTRKGFTDTLLYADFGDYYLILPGDDPDTSKVFYEIRDKKLFRFFPENPKFFSRDSG